MADQRISQLPELSQAAVASGDLLPIADVSASQTKKVKVASLINAGIALVPSGTIDLGLLNQGSTTKIGTSGVADDAITAAKLANDSSIAVQTTAPAVDNFEGRGFFNSSTGNLQVFNGTSYQQVVLDASGISDGAVTAAKIASGTITTAQITSSGLDTAAYADGSVLAAKIASGTITTAQIASGTILGSNISTGTIDTSRIATGAVAYDRIQAVSATDKLLGRSSAGSGTVEEIDCTAAGRALLDDADAAAQRGTLGLGNLALASGSWQDGSSFAGTSTGTNTGDQTITLTGDVTGTGSGTFAATIASGVVSSGKIADGAVIAAKIADGAITADKLDDDSTVVVATAAPAGSGAFVGQQHINTNTGFEYTWTGAEWQRLHGIAAIAFSGAAPLTFSGSYPDNFSAEIAVTVEPQAAATFWGGPVSGSDAAASFRAIAPTDLPLAVSGTPGVIEPGTGLVVTSGVLNHANSISGQTVNGFTIDNQGHIQEARALQPEDIPSLDVSKITTGAFPTTLIADDAITGDKIADYATALIGETTPVAQFTGQLFFNPIDKAFYMWDGNVWQPIGVTVGEIIFAGLYDASTNQVASTTAAGVAIGLTTGSGLPAASVDNSSFYLVVSASGTGTSPAPSGVLVPPDLILSDGSAWNEVDTSSTFGVLDAAGISFTPSGTIASTNVQDAIAELDGSKYGTEFGQLGGFRNLILNGDFAVSQRGTTFTNPATADFILDRWQGGFDGNTTSRTVSRELHTVGQTDVPGNPFAFLRWDQTVAPAALFNQLVHNVEGVRPFAGQEVTLSFYAKAASAITLPSLVIVQVFGTGGSPSANVNTTVASSISITTSWQRFSYTFTMPSISGKTLGTDGNSKIATIFNLPLNAIFTFDISDVQLELGSKATPYERMDVGLQRTLCNRYYLQRLVRVPASTSPPVGVSFPIRMRAIPTISGGGAGVTLFSGSDAGFFVNQTTAAEETFTIVAEI